MNPSSREAAFQQKWTSRSIAKLLVVSRTVSVRAGGLTCFPLTPHLSPALLPGPLQHLLPCVTPETPAGTKPSISLMLETRLLNRRGTMRGNSDTKQEDVLSLEGFPPAPTLACRESETGSAQQTKTMGLETPLSQVSGDE